jgi:acetyl-CoA synthetase
VRAQVDDSLRDVARIMREADSSSVLIEHDTAIATERDLARGVAAGLDLSAPIGLVATPNAVRVPCDMPAVEAAAVMLNEEVRHLVVEVPDRDVGVVSLRDVMAILLQTANPHLWLSSLRIAVESPTWTWLG